MTLSEHWARLRERRWFKPGVVLLFVVGVFVFSADAVMAADTMDKLAIFLAQIVALVMNFVAKMIVEFMQLVIVLMQYNSFTSSTVVTTGWTIVRDTVNMFFVVVLIVIAFATIFGSSRFKWQQQVPRLLIFAVVINFSKTLAGLMIDFGQVIALTFVSAINDIGAGNFLQLFGLTDIMQVQASSAEGIGQDALFEWFASAATALFMILISLFGVLALLVVYLWRIVMLWVLIVLAPLAWFGGGVAGAGKSSATGFSKLSEAYSKWWQYFTCAVAIGPIVSFFLWLTLAVVGSGSFVAQEPALQELVQQNTAGEDSSISGGLSGIMEPNKLIPFVLGIGMIFAGFEAALSVCGSVPGIGGSISSGKKYFQSGLKQIARAPGRIAAGGARAVGRGAGATAGAVAGSADKRLFRGMRASVKENIAERATNVADSQAAKGNALRARIAAGLGESLQKSRKEDIEDVSGPVSDLSKGNKIQQLKAASERAKQGEKGSQVAQDQVFQLMSEMFQDKNMMKRMDDEELQELWQGYGDGFESAMAGDEGAQKSIKNFKQRNPHIAAPEGEVQDFVDDTYYDSEQFKNISEDAIIDANDTGVGDALEKKMSEMYTDYTDKDGNALTAKQAALKGRYGRKVQEAMKERQSDASTMIKNKFDTGTGKFEEGAAEEFKMRIQDNPHELGNIDVDVLNSNGGNNELMAALDDAFSKKQINSLPREYKKAEAAGDLDKQRELFSAMGNAQELLSYRAETSLDDEKATKQRDRFESIMEGLGDGPVSVEKELEQLSETLSETSSRIGQIESQSTGEEVDQARNRMEVVNEAIVNNEFDDLGFSNLGVMGSGAPSASDFDSTEEFKEAQKEWAQDIKKEIKKRMDNLESSDLDPEVKSRLDDLRETQRATKDRLRELDQQGKTGDSGDSPTGDSGPAAGA